MARIDKQALRKQILELNIDNELKSQLLTLVAEQKRYGLVWENSIEDVEESLRENVPVLTEVKDRAIINDNETQKNPNHILIEGDNLEALTALTYTHEGKIDVIYIDPPYNTGNKDFVYNDSYVDSEDSYRHSKWLSFMSRRLKIAKRLLSDKGVIFISIDDNEQSQIKLLCDEIFGEINFVATLVWKSKSGGANDTSAFGVDHEYLLCFAKKSDNIHLNNDKEAVVTTSYNKVDENGKRYSLDRLDKQSLGYLASLDFPIIGPDGKVYVVEHKNPLNKKARWRWGKDTVEERYNELVFIYPYVYTKNYEKEDGQKPRSILFDERFGRTRTGSTDLSSIIGKQNIFTYPKPVKLIKYLTSISSRPSSIILDFFAGSGTTLHATMQLNAEDGGNRQCILVTNNENNICEEVTYERNKRVINGYTTPKGVAVEGLKSNNLRYFKCEMKPRDLSHQSKRELVKAMTDILRIKEDIYTEQSIFGRLSLAGKATLLRYFADGEKQMLIIYDTRVLPFIIREIPQLPGEIKVYIFADGAYPYTEDFRSVLEKVSLVALPNAFNYALKHVLPTSKEDKLPEPDLTDEELEEMMEEAIKAENNEI